MQDPLIVSLIVLMMGIVLMIVVHGTATSNSRQRERVLPVKKGYLLNPFFWALVIIVIMVILPFTGPATIYLSR